VRAPGSETLLERTVTSAGWRLGAQAASGLVLFGRAIVLARLLPVELFGVFSLATAVVTVTSVLGTFGLGPALLHRCEATRDEARAAAVHFTLTLTLSSLWLVLLVATTLAFAPAAHRTALLAIGLATFAAQLAATPRALLVRRVQHRRLAALTLAVALVSTAVGVPMAFAGLGLWSLLAIEAAGAACQLVAFYGWRPVWRPRLVRPGREARYFLSFGLRAAAAQLLERALGRVDRLWTGFALGDTALGLYSRATVFAGYPRQLIGVPVDPVISGSFAELKGNRRRLSEAFLDANAILLRAACLVGGALVVAAPELIAVLLGERWLPMVRSFQLMFLFVLLDPVKFSVSNLFVAVGQPGEVVRARAVQLGVALVAVASLGWRFGIAGVAFAVGLVQLTGIAYLLGRSRRWVDLPLPRLGLAPAVAVASAFAAVAGLVRAGLVPPGDLLGGATKLAAFGAVYALLLVCLEPRDLRRLLGRALSGLRRPREGAVGDE